MISPVSQPTHPGTAHPGPTDTGPARNAPRQPHTPARRSTFVFAGGGTGGHIYPALAIWEAISARLGRSASALFVCADRPVDRAVLGPAAVRFEPSPARPLRRTPRGLWRFARGFLAASAQARRLLDAMSKNNDQLVHVVSLGGFVAGPLARVSLARSLPLTLINLDAYPGRATVMIAKHAARLAQRAPATHTHNAPGSPARAALCTPLSVYDIGAAGGLRWNLIPPIVRASALPPGDPDHCRKALGLDPDRPVLMVTGGSLGAASINRLMIDLLRGGRGGRSVLPTRWQVLHQCGPDPSEPNALSADALRTAYASAGIPALVEPFTARMGAWWGAASLAIGRAGAGTVAEAWASATPAVFLPYPFHKDQHQARNAERLAAAGSALVLTDHASPEPNRSSILPVLDRLLSDPAKLRAMRDAAHALGPADGAQRVADLLLDPQRA